MGWSRNPVRVTQTEINVWLECDGMCGCMDFDVLRREWIRFLINDDVGGLSAVRVCCW